jgi:hypothetical protein
MAIGDRILPTRAPLFALWVCQKSHSGKLSKADQMAANQTRSLPIDRAVPIAALVLARLTHSVNVTDQAVEFVRDFGEILLGAVLENSTLADQLIMFA